MRCRYTAVSRTQNIKSFGWKLQKVHIVLCGFILNMASSKCDRINQGGLNEMEITVFLSLNIKKQNFTVYTRVCTSYGKQLARQYIKRRLKTTCEAVNNVYKNLQKKYS